MVPAFDTLTAQCTTLPGQVGNCVALPGSVSTALIVFGVFGAVFFAFGLFCDVKIITKAGYSGWYVLTAFVPIVNFVMFLVFVFAKWPIQARLEAAERGGAPSYRPSQFAMVQSVATPPARGADPAWPPPPPPVGAGPVQADKRSVIYCSWCGKERAVDAQAIHHCGSMDRPPAYCMNCGTPLAEGADRCASCGTPSTELSR
jgi:hypothetical protein